MGVAEEIARAVAVQVNQETAMEMEVLLHGGDNVHATHFSERGDWAAVAGAILAAVQAAVLFYQMERSPTGPPTTKATVERHIRMTLDTRGISLDGATIHLVAKETAKMTGNE